MRTLAFALILLGGFLAACINGNVDGFGSSNSNGINLESAIEMIDYGLQSNNSNITFNRSSTGLDTADYDGQVNYSFEIIAENLHISNPYEVYLVDSATNVRATITVPPSTIPTRYRVSFGPNMGSDVYRVQTQTTTVAQEIKVYAARLIIRQHGATKTKLYIPLLGATYNVHSSNDNLGSVYNTVSTSHSSVPNVSSAFWKKNPSLYGGNISWGFDTVMRTSGGTSWVALYNRNLTTPIFASEASTTSTIPTLVSVPFSGNAPLFNDFENYGVSVKATSSFTAYVYKAAIWVKLNNFSFGESQFRLDKAVNSTSTVIGASRIYYDASAFSNPSTYFETTIVNNNSPIMIWDAGTNESGLGGATMPASSVFTASPPAVIRSSAFTMTSQNRYLLHPTNISLNLVNASLVVKFER